MRKLFLLLAFILVPVIAWTQPSNPAPWESVLQAGNNAIDGQTACFGNSDDICMSYSASTEDFEFDNTLNDKDVVFSLDVPISTYIDSQLISGAVAQQGALTVGILEDNAFATSSFLYAGSFDASYIGTGTTTGNLAGIFGGATAVSTDALTGAYGLYFTLGLGGGSATNAVGSYIFYSPNSSAASTITNGAGYLFNGLDGGGGASTITSFNGFTGSWAASSNITDFAFFRAQDPTAGTITNNYGLYIPNWTRGTNDYAIYLAGNGTGNSITFDAGDSRIYDDNTDLVIDPAAAGSGRVIFGPTSNADVEMDELGLCGTDITGSTAVVLGTCSGSKRGTLNFSFTKNAGTGIAANIASSLTYDISGTNANATGINSAMTSVVGGSGTNTITALGTSITNSTNYTSGTYQFRGLNLGTVTSPASSAGATIYQIGMQQREMSAFASASAETIIGGVFENDLLVTTGDRLYLEGTGGSTPALGDSYLHYDSGETAIELFVNGTEGLSVDTTYFQTPLTTVVGTLAGNYVALLPAGDITFGPSGQMLTQGNRYAFVYTADGVTPSAAGLKFDLTNVAYAFTDIFGASALSASIATNDWLVHNTGRGMDMFTAGHDLAIGRANAGDITYGNTANTPSHTFLTTDSGTSVVIDATTPLQVLQPTVGDQVTQIKSTATNDDPVEYVRQGRVTTTDATVTTILTLTPPNNYTTTVDCTVLARRTGGVSGAADDGAGYKRYATFKKNAGTVTQIGTTTATATHESVAGWDATITVSGGTVLIRGTGAATTDVTWHTTCRIYEVGS